LSNKDESGFKNGTKTFMKKGLLYLCKP